jgi:hypothetical protein
VKSCIWCLYLLVTLYQRNMMLSFVYKYFQGYRVITGLVARLWFLMEICSRQEILNIVTDASTETTKIGLFSCLYVIIFVNHHIMCFINIIFACYCSKLFLNNNKHCKLDIIFFHISSSY